MDAVSSVGKAGGATEGTDGVSDAEVGGAVAAGLAGAVSSAVVRARMCFGARPPVRQRK